MCKQNRNENRHHCKIMLFLNIGDVLIESDNLPIESDNLLDMLLIESDLLLLEFGNIHGIGNCRHLVVVGI